MTASAGLLMAVLAALVAVLGLLSLGQARALTREQRVGAAERGTWLRAESQCQRMRRAALDREAVIADLQGDLEVLEQQLADIRDARRSIAARCELRVLS